MTNMGDAGYKHNGKLWRACPTKSDNNSFFHAAFGTMDQEGQAYFDKHAQFRRMRWATFLTYFTSDTMPPCLEDALKKCFSANDKYKHVSVNDKENFMNYVSDIIVSERHVITEEIPILAILENIKVVVLSNTQPESAIIIKPNPDILGSYPNVEKPKDEVVMCLEEESFSKLEPVEEDSTSKSNTIILDNETAKANITQPKNVFGKYKKGGSAGSKGVQYQVNLLAMVLLNAFKNLKGWKLSTENEEAGKFDDIVLEQPDDATFIQSKHKESKRKRITLEELTSTNSKNDDFSLPKYFLSYLQIKTKFKIKNIIICTNAEVHERVLTFLNHQEPYSESTLHCRDGDYSFYTLKDEILIDLKTNIKNYYQRNFQNKGIDESAINNENLKDFQKHLQLYFNYPSQSCLEKNTDTSLSLINSCSNSCGIITSSELISKLMYWFQQKDGIYLTEIRAKAMFLEVLRDKYYRKLEHYKLSFKRSNFDFQGPRQVFHISCEGSYLLQVLKVYQTVEDDKTKILFVVPDDDTESQKLVLEVFELPIYTLLVIIWPEIADESVIVEICSKLNDILDTYKYKKIILITEDNNKLLQQIGLHNDIVRISGSINLMDLHSESQERLLKKRHILFQGKNVNLEEIMEGRIIQDYSNALNAEILEKLVRGEEVKVGQRPSELDECIGRYYVSRTFNRKFNKTQDKGEAFLSETQYSHEDPTRHILKKELYSEQFKIWGDEMNEEEYFGEEDIYNVNEKVVIISDSAGTGKSTVLGKLAQTVKENNPHLWVIKLELSNYTKILKDSLRKGKNTVNIIELINSVNATKLTNHLEKFVFSVSQKVVLMMDGMDEISPDYTELTIDLLKQCQEQSNFAKIFITTRPHMIKELEEVSKVKPFILQPFTEQNQIHFLTNYWINGLQLKDDVIKEKCKQYAKALIRKWMNIDNNEGNNFTTIPLQLRMMAEIFQENVIPNESTHWQGCKEYIMEDGVEPNISERMDVTKLYGLFVKKKQYIFAEKVNPSGNAMTNQLIEETFYECLVYHTSLALEVILGKEKLHLFSNYQRGNKNIETKMLKIGIVQKINGKLHFIHRTFADYFVAECLFSELQRNRTIEFQMFLIDTIFIHPQYNVTRTFFDSFLLKIVDSLSPNIFNEYQSLKQEQSMETYKLQSQLIHLLVNENCMAVLLLILNCIDFKNIKGQEINIRTFHIAHFHEDVHKSIFGNTLQLLQNFTRQAGINIKEERGWTPLHFAAKKGHLEMMKFLIERGADINSKNEAGHSALHLAASVNHLNAFKYLLELSTESNIKDNAGFTALQVAAHYSKLEIVKLLVGHGFDFNVKNNDGQTLLHSASSNGHLDTVKYLLQLGIDSSIRDNDGFTALQIATYFGQLETVKFLVEHGSDFNVVNSLGHTLLHSASVNGHVDTIEYLLELGIDCSVRDTGGFTALQTAAFFGELETVKFLVEHGLNFNVVNNIGSTLLHSASTNGHLDTMEYLLELGIDSSVRDIDGLTALQAAAYFGQLGCVKFLVERGCDFTVITNNKSTLLHSASVHGHLDTIKYLLDLGIDSNIRNINHSTALQTAAYFGQLETVKFLVEYGSDFNVVDSIGRTLLHSASENGQLDTVKYLLELGIESNIKTNKGFTALQRAVCWGQLETVKFLVEHGSDFNVVNNIGSTLLHSASINGHLDTLKYLLELGLDANIRDADGFSALQAAVFFGQLEIVKFLIEHGMDFNVVSNSGSTLLHLAGANGHLNIVKYLLQLGVDSSVKDNNGFTVLQRAASSGQLETVKFLVQQGSNFNIINSIGGTLLHSASINGHLDTLKYLLDLGLDINIRDTDGFTALHAAVFFDQLEIVKFLIEHGLDLNVVSNNGSTLLHLAAVNGHLNTVKYLLELGIDPSIRDNSGSTVLQRAVYYGQLETVKLLVEYGLDLSVVNSIGNTVLHSASENGDLDTIKCFLELGIDSNIKNNNGFTALQRAVCWGQLETVKFLVEHGSDFNVVNNIGSTLLHSASINGHLSTLKYLLGLGLDANIRDTGGFTSLQAAVLFGQWEIVKFLIEYGLDINVVSNNGSTLLHLASVNSHLNIVKYLLELSIDFNIKDSNGFTALQVAAYSGQLETVKFLVKHGLDFKIRSDDGSTMLHLACMKGHLDTVKYLLELGIDCTIKENNGSTALQRAVDFGQLETVKYLMEYGVDFNVVNNYGHTLLHSACSNGHMDLTKYLLEINVDFRVRDYNGFTVLHSAAMSGYLDIIKFFVEYGLLDINITSSDGYTLLHLASANAHLDTIKYLLELGIDFNAKNNCGYSAVHLVDNNNQLEIVKCFMKYNLDINVKTTDGFTLSHLTSANGCLQMVKFLLECGVDFRVRDDGGFTPLHLAAEWGQLDTIKLLVEHGLDYNVTTNNGRTLVHLSSEAGHLDTVKYLLELGVDCNIKNNSGRTALHLAVLANHLDIVKLLIEHHVDVNVEDSEGYTALYLAVDSGYSDTVEYLI